MGKVLLYVGLAILVFGVGPLLIAYLLDVIGFPTCQHCHPIDSRDNLKIYYSPTSNFSYRQNRKSGVTVEWGNA